MPTGDMMKDFPLEPRTWQREFLATASHYLSQPHKSNFLAAVCPGAGKTVGLLMLAHHLFKRERANRLYVVVHTDHLRDQWLEESKAVGFTLGTDIPKSNRDWPEDCDGLVLTYQQLTSSSKEIASLVTRDTLQIVAFDEIHHAGDGQSWSEGVKTAFRGAKYRILLTGTPFRNDNRPIPYVKYDKHGRLEAQFTYTYEDALRDGYVAPVHFHTYDLDGRWKRGDNELAKGFGEYLGQQDASDRLNTAIGSKTWREKLIEDAFAKLKELRSEGDPRAGMLIVARDIAHAYQIESDVKRLTKEKPITVTSDDPAASKMIASFKDGADPIIIAVRMISEGVDIPRLRVGVYLTNVRTDLFFWQWVGRYIRVLKGNPIDKLAYLYMPAERSLVEYASTIKDQRVQVLEPKSEIVAARSNGHGEKLPPLKILESAAIPDSVITPDGDISQAEIQAALAVMEAYKIIDRTVRDVVLSLRAAVAVPVAE